MSDKHDAAVVQPEWELIQPDLFGFDNPTAGEELIKVPRHTGERASKDWERVQDILRAYASGEGIRSICSRFHVGHHTLSRLIELHAEDLATLRKQTGRQLRRVSRLLLDRLEFEAHRIPINQVAITLGILLDKQNVLDTGFAAETAAPKEPAERAEDINAYLEELRRRAAQRALASGQSGAPAETESSSSSISEA